MTTKQLLTTILISTVIGFLLILAIYVAINGKNPMNRIGFAIFMSVLPGVLTYLLFRYTKLIAFWWLVGLVYTILFILIAMVQGLGRLV